MAHHFHPKKRFLIAMPLGIVAGLVCTWLASKENPEIWGSMLMWSIITNRMVIALLVGLAGAYTHHPILGFPIHWWLRGFIMGVFASFSLAFGALVSSPEALDIFWYTMIAGGVYGVIIDFFATKFGGEGRNVVT